MSHYPQDSLDAELRTLQTAALAQRALVLERAGHVQHRIKVDGSPVTDTDMEVEQAMRAALLAAHPATAMFGEEAGYDSALPADGCWLVDPIDGTASFIANQPTFTCMAAYIAHGQTLACFIYNYRTGDMYTARRGQGAYKNGQRLDLAAMPLPATALCKTSFVAALDDMLRSTGISCRPAPNGGGHGFTMVADGRTAARFQLHARGYIHDYAPGGLLVQEAGGVLVPINPAEYHYDSHCFVACHPALAARLQKNVNDLRKLEASPAEPIY